MPSPTAAIATVVRPTIRLGVSAARLPVDVAGRLLGEHGNELWPPALVVDGLQATFLQTAGSLLHDDELRAQGRLLSEKVERLRVSDALEADAEAKRHQADAKRAAVHDEVTRKREQTDAAARQKKAAAQRRAEQQEQAAEQEAESAAEAADEARAKARRRIEAQERKERSAALAEERQAVATEKAAAAAARKAAATDARIKAVNRARTS